LSEHECDEVTAATIPTMNSDDDDGNKLFITHIPEDCDCYFDEDKDKGLIMNIPVPKQQKQVYFVPSYMLMARTIQEQPSQRLLKVLFNGGGTDTLCNSRCLYGEVRHLIYWKHQSKD
jgi:hypothetical protein